MSEKQLLNVKNLYVDVEEKQILHGVDLLIGKGETHVLIHHKERRDLVSG